MSPETARQRRNELRREAYDPEVRKKRYAIDRESVSQRSKNMRGLCPLCNMDYRTPYIPRHLVKRHKITFEEACKLCA